MKLAALSADIARSHRDGAAGAKLINGADDGRGAHQSDADGRTKNVGITFQIKAL